MAEIIRLKAPGGAEQLERTWADLPPPAADEIRLRQTAIGVNFIDIYQRFGFYPLPDAKIRGVEAVGIVCTVGADVTSLKLGDPRRLCRCSGRRLRLGVQSSGLARYQAAGLPVR